MQTFARWVTTPENRAAQLAVERVAECICSGRPGRLAHPLYLVGPAGMGKSHLAAALANRIARQSLNLVVTILEARDLGLEHALAAETAVLDARQADLLVIENIHQLREAAFEILVRLLDERAARQLPTVLTATVGPARL